MTPPNSVKKRRQQLHARDVRGFVAFCFYALEEKVVNKSCFQSIFQVQTQDSFQDPINTLSCSKFTLNHWLKSYFFSLVAKSDLGEEPNKL